MSIILFLNETNNSLVINFINDPFFNPLLPSVPYMTHLANTLISISEWIITKNSYDRRDYEPVEGKNLF